MEMCSSKIKISIEQNDERDRESVWGIAKDKTTKQKKSTNFNAYGFFHLSAINCFYDSLFNFFFLAFFSRILNSWMIDYSLRRHGSNSVPLFGSHVSIRFVNLCIRVRYSPDRRQIGTRKSCENGQQQRKNLIWTVSPLLFWTTETKLVTARVSLGTISGSLKIRFCSDIKCNEFCMRQKPG